MNDRLGYTKEGKFDKVTLITDLAEIQHNEYLKRGYGYNNPKCNVDFGKLSSDERMKNYFSVEAILNALEEAKMLVRTP